MLQCAHGVLHAWLANGVLRDSRQARDQEIEFSQPLTHAAFWQPIFARRAFRKHVVSERHKARGSHVRNEGVTVSCNMRILERFC